MVHIADDGICLDPKFFREFNDLPDNFICEIVDEILKPSNNALHGVAITSPSGIDATVEKFYKAITQLVKEGARPSISSWRPSDSFGKPKEPYHPKADPWSSHSYKGGGTSNQSFTQNSKYDFLDSPLHSTTRSREPSAPKKGIFDRLRDFPFNQSHDKPNSSYNYNRDRTWNSNFGFYRSHDYGRSSKRSLFDDDSDAYDPWDLKSLPREERSRYQQHYRPEYSRRERPFSYNWKPPLIETTPYSFLRGIRITPEIRHEIIYGNRPIEFGSLFDQRADIGLLYTQECQQAANDYYRTFPRKDVMNYGGRDLNQLSLFGILNYRKYREDCIRDIEQCHEILSLPVNPALRQLPMPELMTLRDQLQSKINTELNTWVLSNAIDIGSEAVGTFLNGDTGVGFLDKYMNLSSFPRRINDAKGNRLWNYSLQQLSGTGGIAKSPWLIISMLLSISLVGSAQDGMREYESKQKTLEKRRAAINRRLQYEEQGTKMLTHVTTGTMHSSTASSRDSSMRAIKFNSQAARTLPRNPPKSRIAPVKKYDSMESGSEFSSDEYSSDEDYEYESDYDDSNTKPSKGEQKRQRRMEELIQKSRDFEL